MPLQIPRNDLVALKFENSYHTPVCNVLDILLFLVCNDVIEFELTTVLIKFLHDVNNRILKHLCKFQVDILIKVTH